ncbi:MAG: 30S ribosomal protein S2, partial [Brevibacterium aurantiacum]
KDKLEKTLGGIRDMQRTPSAVWIVDTKKEHLAVDEARKLGIPVIAILDTNCDPDDVNYPIPGNDDAIRSVSLLTRVIADAVAEGLIARHSSDDDSGEKNVSAVEPMPEWERELLEGNAPASEEAAAPAADAAEKPAAEEAAAPAADAAAEKPAAEEAAAPAAEATEETAAPAADAAADSTESTES